jgi:glutathione peroxidase
MKFAHVSATVVIVAALALLVMRATASADDPKPGKSAGEPTTRPDSSALSFVMKDIDGQDVDLRTYRGNVVLMVNVASRCGYTKQYKGLEAMYEKYKDKGLVIIGFPANNFGSQEPGSDAQIKEFCTSKFGVSFPMMSKISVAGEDKHPLYKYLTEPSTAGEFGGEIGWNFTKFLVGRDGRVYARFNSKVDPADPQFVAALEKGLAAAR